MLILRITAFVAIFFKVVLALGILIRTERTGCPPGTSGRVTWMCLLR
jgi:hypothetical protein